MTAEELEALLTEPAALAALRSALALPTEPVAQALRELQESSARLEDRLGRVEAALERLAEAQARTEQRLQELAESSDRRFTELAQQMAALAEQTNELSARTDRRFTELAQQMAALAEQTNELSARTDRRFTELAQQMAALAEQTNELSARTDRRFTELCDSLRRLAEGQAAFEQRTDRRLAHIHTELGALGHHFGSWLEDDVMLDLPHWLGQRGVILDGSLDAAHVSTAGGREEELDGRGIAHDTSGPLELLIEAKIRVRSREVVEFSKKLSRVAVAEVEPGVRQLGILVGRIIDGSARAEAAEHGIWLASTRELRHAALLAA